MFIIAFFVVGADVFERYDPNVSQYDRGPGAPRLFAQNFQAPSSKFWFGTDGQDRDPESR